MRTPVWRSDLEGRVGGGEECPPAASSLLQLWKTVSRLALKTRSWGDLNGALFTFRAVVEKRLAACVNLIPQITSM